MQPQPMSRIAPFVVDATGVGPVVASHAPSWLLIRRLGPDDRVALAEHFISLPRQDRRTRFGGNASDAAIQRHCDGLDLDETVCFAALDASGAVVGAALGFAYGAGDGPHRQCVEVAVSVAPEHRRRGLGTDLVSRVHHATAARGADAAVFEFDPSNAAIRGLVRRLGGMVRPFAESCVIPLSPLQ
ncbi:MAG TPA: GNAT family N-acetyltransferase [Acetobacteraceae bacterium]|nr:GNAT family N-acetyltransferase [Acetobacteraceae bacterium]